MWPFSETNAAAMGMLKTRAASRRRVWFDFSLQGRAFAHCRLGVFAFH